jgi:hypothetical protein
MERNMIALWILAGAIMLLPVFALIAFAAIGVWVDSFGTSGNVD